MSIVKDPSVKISFSEYNKHMPIIGLKTYLIKGNEKRKSIKKSIETGFRHFECNFNLKEITDVVEVVNTCISEGLVTKDEIFLTATCDLGAALYADSGYMYSFFDKSRKANGMQCLDLLLLHNPVPTKRKEKRKSQLSTKPNNLYVNNNIYNGWVSFMEYWRCGLTCMIGLSNFNADQLKRVANHGYCSINRIDSNNYLIPNELIEVCKANRIVLTSYYSLGKHQEHKKFISQPVVTDPRIFDIARRYKKSTTQIIARYLVESGTISKDFLEQSTDIFSFKLKPNEMKTLEDCAYCLSKFFVHDVVVDKEAG